MDIKSRQVLTFMALCLATAAMLSFTASCSLTGMQFGFPVIVQKGTSSTFSQDFAAASDFENINIDFPQFDSLMSGQGLTTAGLPDAGNSAISGLGSLGSLFDLSKFNLH